MNPTYRRRGRFVGCWGVVMFVLELSIVVGLILLNGFLSMSELALVSARRGRLEQMVRSGSRGAQAALDLAGNPGRLLSAIQIGITLVGIIAGAFSGATIAERGDAWLEEQGVPTRVAEPLAFTVVIAVITYFSVVLGELVPKQIGLRNAERIAAIVARPMQVFAFVASPVVGLLDWSARLGLRLLGRSEQPETQVTDDDIKASENANPVKTLRMRYDAWKKAGSKPGWCAIRLP